MSERPEWMPSNGEMFTIDGRGDSTSYTSHERNAIEQAHRRTGLRAQIAVLEEMVEYHGVDMRWANLKIAALRKELKHG